VESKNPEPVVVVEKPPEKKGFWARLFSSNKDKEKEKEKEKEKAKEKVP